VSSSSARKLEAGSRDYDLSGDLSDPESLRDRVITVDDDITIYASVMGELDCRAQPRRDRHWLSYGQARQSQATYSL